MFLEMPEGYQGYDCRYHHDDHPGHKVPAELESHQKAENGPEFAERIDEQSFADHMRTIACRGTVLK